LLLVFPIPQRLIRNNFLREEQLVRNTIAEQKNKILIYFSTCSIYDSSKTNSPYVIHKLKMEELIKNACEQFLILRVSNAVGKGGNPNLLLNYIVRAVQENQTINVHTKATRNLIDAEDIQQITLQLLESKVYNHTVNVAYPYNFGIIEILEIVERFFHKKLDLNLIKSGESYNISSPEAEEYFVQHQKMIKDTYLINILKKYYI